MVLVPFTNVMRIGQGFNSYTQACCIDQAVTFTPIIKPRAGYTQPTDASTSTANDVATTSTILPGADPERVSQKVAYTCTFVQNMSEIAKELNVSAALCIKKGSLDASGSGQYIDEEQFNKSDFTFMVKVSVTNQTSTDSPNCTFNKVNGLKTDGSNFLEIYGDHFISGFIQGGEFTAIVSVKCFDKSSTNKIQADLKGSFNAVSASGNFNKLAKEMSKEMETTVSVSWVGGGGLKNADLQWDIQTMMDVAASFPQRVAACPDTTFAILTKYTNIKSYYSSLPVTFNPVTYENAQLYTLGLLDDYMGYKVHLKTVREMRLAPVEWEQNTEDGDDESFDTTPADLDYARREILLNMLLIVDRVDKIEGRPDLATMFILGADATDYRPDEKDLVGPEDPAVFAMRLPIRAASRITAPPTKLTQEQLEKLKTFEELFPSPITQLKAKEYKEVLDQDPTLTNPLAYNYVVLHTTRRESPHGIEELHAAFRQLARNNENDKGLVFGVFLPDEEPKANISSDVTVPSFWVRHKNGSSRSMHGGGASKRFNNFMEKVLNTDDWNMPAERGRFKKISEEKNRMGEAVKKAGVSAAAAAAAALQNRAQTPIQKPRAEGGTLLKKDETSDNDQSSG